jgi:hypothetical protein
MTSQNDYCATSGTKNNLTPPHTRTCKKKNTTSPPPNTLQKPQTIYPIVLTHASHTTPSHSDVTSPNSAVTSPKTTFFWRHTSLCAVTHLDIWRHTNYHRNMIPLRDFCKNPNKFLSQLPLTLTRYDKPVATVSPPFPLIETKPPEPPATKQPHLETPRRKPPEPKEQDNPFCKHNSMKGLCRYGCK